MTHSAELAELAKALSAAQGEFGAIPKTANNPFFRSSYADLATVIKTSGPIVAKHGLSVSQHISMTDSGHDTLTTLLLHESGQYIESTMRLHLVKDDPQGQGSACSYARRYSYMSVLGLVADEDDDDGNRASKPRPQQRPADQRPRRSTPVTDPKASSSALESNPVAAATQADPETGEKVHNLTALMLSEIQGAERPKFIQALETKHHCQIAKVPESLVADVEAMIGAWVGA